jgi:hypothetical protein
MRAPAVLLLGGVLGCSLISRSASTRAPTAQLTIQVLRSLTPDVFPRLAIEDYELSAGMTTVLMCYVEVRRPDLRLATHAGSFPCTLSLRDALGAVSRRPITLGRNLDGMTEASSLGGGCSVPKLPPGSYLGWLTCGVHDSMPLAFRVTKSGVLQRTRHAPAHPPAARR